jgi:Co/Zn/Cd efflux system component
VTDSANNVLGLIASKFSSPQPDREHPYGHSKFEAVGALGIASFLAIPSPIYEGELMTLSLLTRCSLRFGKNNKF